MRHARKINHLGRTNTHRKAMLSNLACSLIKHKRITTTLAKAKALRVFIEPLITKSKAANNPEITPVVKKITVTHKDNTVSEVERKIRVNSSTPARRVVFSYLKDKDAVKELFGAVASKVADRPGGYTRILKTGFRKGDSAETCIIELVDYNENMLTDKSAKEKATTRRSRRGGKKKATTTETANTTAPIQEVKTEQPTAEATDVVSETEKKKEE
ncbi:MAG: 50S ribosomal protein L17 [Bacteroidales bacterium]|jgi:large subunit ribosomal protein L17|nr:50S ribosomal protein L17 [Bacteroidales bacterium]